MATSTRRDVASLSCQRTFLEHKDALLCDQIAADEFFCIVLSVSGLYDLHTCFVPSISALESAKPVLHKQLMDLYNTYFSQKEIQNDLNHIPEPKCDIDEELDYELAVKLSLDECQWGGSDIYEVNPSPLPYITQGSENNANGNESQNRSWAKIVQNSTVHNEKLNANEVTCNTNGVMHDNHNNFSLRHKNVHEREHKFDNCNSTTSRNSEQFNGNSFDKSLSVQTKKKKRKSKKGSASGVERPIVGKPCLFWFRRDLRIYDNPALLEAAGSNSPIVPVFIWSEEEEGPLAAGGATKVWLHHALEKFNECLQNKYGVSMIFRKTNSCLEELQHLISETRASTVVWNDLYEPYLKERDDNINKNLEQRGVTVKRYHSYLLYAPGQLNTENWSMRFIGSVSHFMSCCRHSCPDPIGQPVDPPGILPMIGNSPNSLRLEELGLARMPRRKDGTVIDWSAQMRADWDFSEDGAYDALQLFLSDGIRRYEKESSRGDQLNTSRISPYMHFGQISPRQVLWEAKPAKSQKYLRKLAWRDLSYWLLHLWPDMPSQPIRPHYAKQRWSNNRSHLRAWQRGYTGYPLVDAAMRQLWKEGWLNNYMRHVVASFLIAYLHLTWVEGYKWFQDTLLDADVAINAMMWQNGGMSGPDHWNFVMHPVDAAMTCDPRGTYVRRWLPVLKDLPDEFIHQPWKCPPSILRRAKVQLGENYPQRIITNLEEAREQSLRDVVEMRRAHRGQYIDPRTGNDLVPLPSGLLIPVITRKEFKYKTNDPNAKDNPYTAVLRGYRSRKRDEIIAREQQVDFLASTMFECAERHRRAESANLDYL